LKHNLKYVGDVLLVRPSDRVNNILNIFNNFHKRLQFTIEIEEKHCIN